MVDVDEKLAFFLDDYPGEDAEKAIDEVVGDVNLQYRARRYRMIGEALRNELPQAIDSGFHASVMAQLRAESTETGRHGRPLLRILYGDLLRK